MKRVGLITNLSKDPDGSKTERIVEEAIKLGIEVLVSHHIYNLIGKGTVADQDELFLLSDIIMSLGGDGTYFRQHVRQPYAKANFGHKYGHFRIFDRYRFKPCRESIAI